MANEFRIEASEGAAGIPVLAVVGYFGQEAGQELRLQAEVLLRAGKVRLVLDLARCTVLNSPGIGRLMDLSLEIVDDFKGRVVLCGLDSLKQRVLDMAGILELTGHERDVAAACERIRAA